MPIVSMSKRSRRTRARNITHLAEIASVTWPIVATFGYGFRNGCGGP